MSEKKSKTVSLQNNGDIPFADDEDNSTPMSSDDNINRFAENRRPSIAERRNVTTLKVHINNEKSNDHNSSDESNDDSPQPLKLNPATGGPNSGRGLRRNSISMPTGLNDLEVFQQAHRQNDDTFVQISDGSESAICSTPVTPTPTEISRTISYDDHSDDSEEEKHRMLVNRGSLRSKRRLSINPLPSLRLNDKDMIANEFDSQSMISNQNSVTSVNSLASLLKEKMQMFPHMIRKRRRAPHEYKLKAFVGTLFLIIVFLTGYAFIIHQQVLSRSYFPFLNFNNAKRTFHITDQFHRDIIKGKLGTTLTSENPYLCLGDNIINDGSICFEWDGNSRLYLNFEAAEQQRCYKVRWQALAEGVYPTDCFDVSEELGHWYGGGVTKDSSWPLDESSFEFSAFVTGDATINQYGNALKRYFINSLAVAISVDPKSPLFISMNRGSSKQFCLRAGNDNFAFVNRITPYPELNYKICVGDDMKTLHQSMTQKSLWDGLKEADINIIHTLIEEPVYQIPATVNLTDTSIYNYTENVISMGFLKLGHVLVNEFWQKNMGDFTLDQERFSSLEDTVHILHRRGFRIILTVQPFISTDSPNFGEAVRNKLLIYERLSEKSIPALTRYKSVTSAGVLDVTNNASIPWLLEKLNKVVSEYQIDGFFLDFGTAQNMPHYYQCTKTLLNPDQYKTIFTDGLEGKLSLIGVNGAIDVPRPPAFLSLPPVNSSWVGLASIVTTAISYGVIGYPFILPGAVGGDFFLEGNATKMLSYYTFAQPPLPDQELYIRWLQLVTFLPAIRFSHLPTEYNSDFVTLVAKDLAGIRQKTVIPILKKYLSDAMNEGLPLIRPLWMLDPIDPACQEVNDEFAVGEELIVAPILEESQLKREVYLPQGVWKDGIDGSLRKGMRWIHNYNVPIDKIAYFVKMPDNTRF